MEKRVDGEFSMNMYYARIMACLARVNKSIQRENVVVASFQVLTSLQWLF